MNDKIKLSGAKWSKVSELKSGIKIAVPDVKEGVLWDEIESIRPIGRNEVWDIEIEDTHNFIGNDIFAHNTYTNGGVALETDIVAYDEGGNIKKATFGDNIAGVMIGFGENGSVSYEFNGRAKIKVSDENGDIKTGDRLIVSQTKPGFAMKQTEAGQSLGIALESFTSTASATGQIISFVDLGYWAPSTQAATNVGDVSVSSGGTSSVLAALAESVAAKVQTLWAKSDIIAEGVKKTYFVLADTVKSQFGELGFDVQTMVSSWLTRDVAISPNASDAEQSIFQGNSAKAADQSKVDLAENGSYLATYGVDSTRGEIVLTGSSEISGGEARIFFDFSFTSIISEKAPIKVIITPTTVTQGQLYVDTKTPYGFVIKSINGPGNGSFDWLVVARRKGYEANDIQSVPIAESPTPTPQPLESPSPETSVESTHEATPTSEESVTPTPEVTPEATPESTPQSTPEATPEATPSPEPTPSPSADPTPQPTTSPSAEPIPEATPEV